jgi:hypothetical protein
MTVVIIIAAITVIITAIRSGGAATTTDGWPSARNGKGERGYPLAPLPFQLFSSSDADYEHCMNLQNVNCSLGV